MSEVQEQLDRQLGKPASFHLRWMEMVRMRLDRPTQYRWCGKLQDHPMLEVAHRKMEDWTSVICPRALDPQCCWRRQPRSKSSGTYYRSPALHLPMCHLQPRVNLKLATPSILRQAVQSHSHHLRPPKVEACRLPQLPVKLLLYLAH